MAPKQRIHKSIEEKVRIIACVEGGMSHLAASKEFGVSRPAVTKMLKEKDLITAKHEQPWSATPVAAPHKRKKTPRRHDTLSVDIKSDGASSSSSSSSAPAVSSPEPTQIDVQPLLHAHHVLTDDNTSSSTDQPRRPRVLLAASGSVATVKVPALAVQLAAVADVRVVVTKAAQFFLDKAATYDPEAHAAFIALSLPILRDDDEWNAWSSLGDPVLHIHLRDWADVMCIAPLSANTMAKLAGGLCDNLVTCVARAWSTAKPLIVAPAMNTQMYAHPATESHLHLLRSFGYSIVSPVSKTLACGEVGNGALASVDTIVGTVVRSLVLLAPSTPHAPSPL
ncbi:hypothetical protein H257_05389 [Aphanomyces astaci]|uniref:Flavoprotein domain-containing protein n=1 Tax=Aphanomyces astaci TaxID=112090 RepID=W4GS25_APHAT|nr:hypothetical protein H257_05389 [Aphanomyces astaci]ETV81819.1 hypothetical protein H257_05389 [Aphanomyces astaci]|eukprot:XP_009828556.1 hypothetical protein H257_05389 [Aphanomyces astaci]